MPSREDESLRMKRDAQRRGIGRRGSAFVYERSIRIDHGRAEQMRETFGLDLVMGNAKG